MTVSIDLSPEEDQRLHELTRECGGDQEAAIRRLFGRPSTNRPTNALETLRRIRQSPDPEAAWVAYVAEQRKATAEMFEEWREDEAAMTPEEIAKEEAEWEQTKANINAYRAEEGRGPAFE